jgi:hypothetical protein
VDSNKKARVYSKSMKVHHMIVANCQRKIHCFRHIDGVPSDVEEPPFFILMRHENRVKNFSGEETAT